MIKYLRKSLKKIRSMKMKIIISKKRNKSNSSLNVEYFIKLIKYQASHLS